jgi:cobalt-zinc-cadmium efflux system membrane fusion protein
MKGEAMQSTETKKTVPAPRRRVMWIGLGAVTVLAIAFGLWFGTQHGSRPKLRERTAMSSMADMSTPSNDDSMDSPAANADLQVELGPDDLKKAKVQTVHVEVKKAASTLRVPGIVNPDEYREVHVTSLVGGVIRQVPVVLGDHVKRGQPLAVVFSSELAEAENQYLSHSAELEADHKKLVRTQNLVKLGAASQQEEEDVEAMHAGHESYVRAALEKLKLLGASDQQIASLKQAEQIDPNFVVPAPINGVVLTRAANLGLVVNTALELFTVADLSTVWIMASINEKDFASVRVGTAATVTAQAYPGRLWKGRVIYIQPQVDPSTRTAQARIEVANPHEDLRIGMYTDVDFTFAGAPGPVVPEAAVQSIGERRFVFLPVKDNDGTFALRQVRLGPAAGGYYSVLQGLKMKDEVVTDGSFILKAEALRQHPELQ